MGNLERADGERKMSIRIDNGTHYADIDVVVFDDDPNALHVRHGDHIISFCVDATGVVDIAITNDGVGEQYDFGKAKLVGR